jgi:hypothetical protein
MLTHSLAERLCDTYLLISSGLWLRYGCLSRLTQVATICFISKMFALMRKLLVLGHGTSRIPLHANAQLLMAGDLDMFSSSTLSRFGINREAYSMSIKAFEQ